MTFDDVLKAYRKLGRVKRFDPQHYAAIDSYSTHDLSKWPSSGPIASIHRMKDPASHSSELFRDPKTLVDYCNFGNAVGTWNAHGKARWAAGKGWIVADVELTQEQDEVGDFLSVIFALRVLDDGWVAAVWPSGGREALTQVLGLKWPAKMKPAKVWYGE
jgi:hypothetical protein